MTEKQIVTSYKHITFKDIEGKKSNFINAWLKDNDDILRYDDVGIFPVKSKCPKNIYNLWTPFKMELVTEYKDKPDELEIIKKHIKILCNNEEKMYNYVICWLAQMIQCPDLKTIVIVLISKQGAGKSTLVNLLTYILGVAKVFETAKPSRDVWGDFNGQMKDAFFVNLNELSLKEMEASEGEFLKLVTEPTITINEKGIGQYSISSHHRFLITTNKEIPVKAGRRTVFIRSSDELIGNKEYFDELYKIINDTDVQKTFYEYLKNYTFEGKDMSHFMSFEQPISEYGNAIKEASMSIPEQFLRDFTYNNIEHDKVEKFGKDLFKDFETWKTKNNITYTTTPQKLGISISYLNLSGITKGRHTRDGDSKYYDIKFLKKYFKIGICEIPIVCNEPIKEDDEEIDEEIEYVEE